MITNTAPVVRTGRAIPLVTAPTTPTIAANPGRRFLYVSGVASIIISFGGVASATNPGIPLAAGVPYQPLIPPGDALWIQAATGTTTATVMEG
jgi:hypothetical protein